MGDPHDAASWERRLRAMAHTRIPDAEVAPCAQLLSAYMEGALWTARRFSACGIDPGNGPVPNIVGAMHEVFMSPITTLDDGSEVQILASHLRWWGRRPLDEPLDLLTTRRELLMRVSPRDWFRLAGVEETHHAISYRRHLLTVDVFPSRSLEAYHAREPEFQAMKYKIAFADQRHLPDAVRIRLRSIHAGAAHIRAARGSGAPQGSDPHL